MIKSEKKHTLHSMFDLFLLANDKVNLCTHELFWYSQLLTHLWTLDEVHCECLRKNSPMNSREVAVIDVNCQMNCSMYPHMPELVPVNFYAKDLFWNR